MRKFWSYILFLIPFVHFSQELNIPVDDHYFEDQVYVGLQYINTTGKSSVEDIGLPYSFNAGFIKDIPLNKRRNWAIGLGLGYNLDIQKHDIDIVENGDKISLNAGDRFSTYQYTAHNLEIPLELRWRTSTATKSSFWRIYTGVSYSNAFSYKAELDDTTFKNFKGYAKNNFTLYTSIGYGTWNFHIKYYLKPYLDDVTDSNGANIKIHPLKLGLMFYIF